MRARISTTLAALLVTAAAPLITATPHLLAQTQADALDGLDAVLLVGGKEVPGKSAFSVTRGDFVYLFSTADTKTTFERDPAKYEIQLGGVCARMGKTAGGNPSDFIVHEGKIYVFGSDDCHKKFQANPAKYLPTPPAPLSSAPDAAARGKRIVDRAIATLGGATRLDAVTAYAESFAQVQERPQGSVTMTTKIIWAFPDRVRQERTMALADKTMSSATVVSPQGMWFLSGQGQAYPMRAASRASLEQEFGRHPVALLRRRRAPGFKAVALGATTTDGVTMDTVRIVSGAIDVTLAVRPDGAIHNATFRDRGSDGDYGTFVIAYSDFKVVNGLRLPFGARATFNGQPFPPLTMTLDAIVINPPVDASLFAPKAAVAR